MGIAASVVAANHRLQHDGPGRGCVGEVAQQQWRQRVRALDELAHVVALGPAFGSADQGGEVVLHRLVLRVSDGAQPRFVDDAEADLTGQIGDDRLPALGCRHQHIERLAAGVVERVTLRALLDPTLEDGRDHGDLVAEALL